MVTFFTACGQISLPANKINYLWAVLEQKTTMKNICITLLALLISATAVLAQEDAQERKTLEYPDLPGHLIIDFGLNFWSGGPDTLELGAWGSKSVGLYYVGNIELGNSPFSLSPGLGLSMEKYDFSSDVSITEGTSATEVVSLTNLYPNATVDKTKLAATYLEVPLEIRYRLNRINPDQGFKLALGFKAGILLTSHTKVKIDETNRSTIKIKDDYNMNSFRGSVVGRIGVGGFNLFYEQSLTEIFQNGQAPEGENPTPFKVGFSFTGF